MSAGRRVPAYYELLDEDGSLGERFAARECVGSAWDPRIQNAAPVSALLVRAMERCAPREDMRLVRVQVDLLGPVPICDELWVYAQLDRTGAQIELLSAHMLAPAPTGALRTVAKASAWRFAHYDTVDLVHTPVPPLPPPGAPEAFEVDGRRFPGYVTSLDWQMVTELSASPAECWAKPKVELVQGETLTSTERLFTVADAANGLGTRVEMRDWSFMNTDLAVHLHRIPDGEWVGMRADTHYGPDGVGISTGTLFDEHGAVGSIQQAQLLRPAAR